MVGDFEETRSNKTGVITEVIYSESAETYIDITDNLTFLKDGKSFLWTSEKDGYNHIYKVSLLDGSEQQLTTGKWEVTEMIGVNEANKSIYYMSTEESPLERHLYSINLKGTGKKKISTRKGQNEVEFSKGFKYYINFHSSANTPYFITLNDARGNELKVLKDLLGPGSLKIVYKWPEIRHFIRNPYKT